MIHQLKHIAQKNFPLWVILGVDILLATFSFSLACIIIGTINDEAVTARNFLLALAIVLILRFIGFVITKSHMGIIKYTSSKDAIRLVTAVIISTSGIISIEGIYYYWSSEHLLTPAVLVMDALILIFALSSFRLGFKMLYRRSIPVKRDNRMELIVYGAGEAGVVVKKSLDSDLKSRRKVIAFIDDNPKLQGKRVEGVKIYSPEEGYSALIEGNEEVEVLLAIQNISHSDKKRIIEEFLEKKVVLKIIPPIDSWFEGEFNPKTIKTVNIEDLLERDPIVLNKNKISSELGNQVILVTGAAGSIGSEIARQCLAFEPKLLVLIDQGESPLYEIENELKGNKNVEFIIADVSNPCRMKKIFSYFKPSYVFHAAAYKHVPLMENNPYEAINTNVFGTQIVANLAVEYNADKFVFVSTDKAVNPTNIMGASKRIAEIYVQSLNAKLQLESDNHTKFVTTRFGNVLGSNGSVIPLFKKQIEQGGPVTVTHPEITRFFMTIHEACQLVLEAGVMGHGGEIYIFDMGESVKIVDLAKKMINLSGYVEGKDIKIKFCGLRPGEKLKEELLNNRENTIGTHNPKIMVAHVQEYNYLEVNKIISELFKEKDNLRNRSLVRTMKKIVPEYISNNSIYEELDKKLLNTK